MHMAFIDESVIPENRKKEKQSEEPGGAVS
jgi:hypothetical protein